MKTNSHSSWPRLVTHPNPLTNNSIWSCKTLSIKRSPRTCSPTRSWWRKSKPSLLPSSINALYSKTPYLFYYSDKPNDDVTTVSVRRAREQVHEPVQHLQEGDKVTEEQSGQSGDEFHVTEERVQKHHGDLGGLILKRRRPERQLHHIQEHRQTQRTRIHQTQLLHLQVQRDQAHY